MGAAPQATEGRPGGRRLSDLGLRAASGLALVAAALLAARVGGFFFLVSWLAASCAVLWEWLRLPDREVPKITVAVGVVSLVLIAILGRANPGEALFTLAVACVAQAFLSEAPRKLWVVGGQLYAGLLLVSVLALRFSFPFGSRAIIWLFAVVWSTDVFAYFAGRLIGGPKLWPRVSPSKTWSGTLSGVAAGALIGTFSAARDLPAQPATVQIFVLSLVAAILSQAGDAFESALKRAFGRKDSGTLIPGHGGMMDRLDGFIAAAIFAFVVGYARDLPSVASGLFYWA